MNNTFVRPVFIYQHLLHRVDRVADHALRVKDLPLDGHARGFGVQAGISINEWLSVFAVKSVYINLRPDSTLSDADGRVDIAADLYYFFSYSTKTEGVVFKGLLYGFAIGFTISMGSPQEDCLMFDSWSSSTERTAADTETLPPWLSLPGFPSPCSFSL